VTAPRQKLATRMIALALAQMVLLAAAALVIFYITRPEHGPHGLGLHGPHGPHGPPPPPDDRRGLALGPWLTLAVGCVLLAIGAVLTARWIVRPIERLTATAVALGKGDLEARSHVTRADELGELGQRIDDMGERIHQMLANERELLANVAHELRTPLSRIGVALDLANEGDGARARASLAEIAVDVAELEVIVDDVLTALRYDVTRGASLPLHIAETAPAEIANASAERLRARHPERPLELAVADGLPAIAVDPVLFRRVIDNLVENSHKYTPDANAPIRLAVKPASDQRAVTFEVVDRGIGIATGDMPNIYNAFFRSDRSRSRETGGVGLGLTLAKRIVEAHHGSIEITSSAGTGTRAIVTIPIA